MTTIFDCCDCCDATMTDAEKAAGPRFGQSLCDACAAEYAAANPEHAQPATAPENAGEIILEPTWGGVLPILVAAMLDGTDEGRQASRKEFAHMARVADALKPTLDTLRKAEACIAGSLKARGYEAGSTVDGWEPAVAAEVRTLAEVRATLARFGGAS